MDKSKLELEPKDKIVSFKLSKEMSMPIMLRDGFQRKEVEILFEKLQEAGFGIYVIGRPGKGGSAKFIANDKCPEKYVISFKVKRLHKEYAGVPEDKPFTIKNADGTEEILSKKPLTQSEKILMIERKPKSIPVNINSGYVCSVAQNYLFVDKIANGGFNRIADALNDVWNDIKSFVSAKGTKYMSPKDEVESSLMGKQYYQLTDKPIKNASIDRKVKDDD